MTFPNFLIAANNSNWLDMYRLNSFNIMSAAAAAAVSAGGQLTSGGGQLASSGGQLASSLGQLSSPPSGGGNHLSQHQLASLQPLAPQLPHHMAVAALAGLSDTQRAALIGKSSTSLSAWSVLFFVSFISINSRHCPSWMLFQSSILVFSYNNP